MWSQFFESINSISRSIFLLDLLRVHSISGSILIYICLTLDDGGSTPDQDPYPVLFISILFALLLHKSYFIFYFSGAILITLNDNLELIVLCRHRDFFKDEIDVCCYSIFLVNSIFYCELSILLTSFTCMLNICVVEILFIHFL